MRRFLGFSPVRDWWLPYLMVLPSSVFIVLVLAYPLVSAVISSFFESPPGGSGEARFVGLAHYLSLLHDPALRMALRNSVAWTLSVVFGQFLIGLGIALLLNREVRGRSIYRSLLLIPWVVPNIAAALTWKWIYDGQFGVFNYALKRLGLIERGIAWLGLPEFVLAAVVAVAIWKGIPFVAVVLLAGLQSIPQDLYEAASIDGAGAWGRFVNVTVPGLRPVALITLLLSFIWTFNSFDLIYIMTKGGPANATQTAPVFTYLTAFYYFRLNEAAALGTIMLMVLLIASYFYIRVLRMEEQ